MLETLLFLALYVLLCAPQVVRQPPDFGWLTASALLAGMLAALSAIDLVQTRLPDLLTLPLAGFGLLVNWSVAPQSLLPHALAAAGALALMVAVAVLYERFRGRAGLGLGDAKLLAAAGAWVGPEGLPVVLLWASGSALLGVLLLHLRKGTVTGQTRIPFGPFLAFGLWLVWIYGAR